MTKDGSRIGNIAYEYSWVVRDLKRYAKGLKHVKRAETVGSVAEHVWGTKAERSEEMATKRQRS